MCVCERDDQGFHGLYEFHIHICQLCLALYLLNIVVVLLCNSHLFLVMPNMGIFYLIHDLLRRKLLYL